MYIIDQKIVEIKNIINLTQYSILIKKYIFRKNDTLFKISDKYTILKLV